MDEIHELQAFELAGRIAQRELSPREVVDALISRIERLDGHYRAFLARDFEAARESAARAEQAVMDGGPLGALHGVPVGLKDLFDTAGLRTTCGSRILKDRVPDEDAHAVQRLRAAGAIILGKLHMTEFAGTDHHPDFPPPRNAFDPRRSPGGSSSGSGVAVAARMCPVALGSDTVASIRNPAAWNGCVGFKPSYGRVSRHGVYPLAASYDHVGPLTRSVRDAALVTAVLAGHDPRDPTSLRRPLSADWPRLSAPSSLRIGYDERFVLDKTHPDVARCTQEACSALVDQGAERVDVTLPMVDESVEDYGTILAAEIAMAHREHYPARADDYCESFRTLLGIEVTTDALSRAFQFREAFRDSVADLFTRVDVLVMPVCPLNAPPLIDQPFPLHDALRFMRYTYHWNLAGVPAISIPWGLDGDGLPNAVQIVGPVHQEARVLSVARAIERPLAPPPLPGALA